MDEVSCIEDGSNACEFEDISIGVAVSFSPRDLDIKWRTESLDTNANLSLAEAILVDRR